MWHKREISEAEMAGRGFRVERMEEGAQRMFLVDGLGLIEKIPLPGRPSSNENGWPVNRVPFATQVIAPLKSTMVVFVVFSQRDEEVYQKLAMDYFPPE